MNQTKSSLPSELEQIFSDVQNCIDARLYYPAVLMALTIPEICWALMQPDNQEFVKAKHYIEIVDKYKPDDNSIGMDGAGLYRLRGGVVHRGNAAGHTHSDWTHVMFTTPESRVGMHAIVLIDEDTASKAYTLDLRMFVAGIIQMARNWYHDNHQSEHIAANVAQLLSFRPHGLSPFTDGIAVVASGIDYPDFRGNCLFRASS